jgi:hypothetical protein
MSFFSRSRSKGHYPNYNHGSGYYKRPHSSGILGKIFEALIGSKRHSRSYSNHERGHYPNHNNGHYPNRHHRKSSWS